LEIFLDDDFDAFYAVAHSTSLVNVQVSVGSDTTLPELDIPAVRLFFCCTALVPIIDCSLIQKKQKRKPVFPVISQDNTPEIDEGGQDALDVTEDADLRKRAVSFAGSATGEEEISENISAPPKKKRRKKSTTRGGGPSNTEVNPQELARLHIIPTPSADVTGSNTVPLTIEGRENATSQDALAAALGQERGAGESKNARRKKQRSQQFQPATESIFDASTQSIITGDENPQSLPSKKRSKRSKTQEIPFSEQLAGAISETGGVQYFHCCLLYIHQIYAA
jgi:hypothetical protein